MDSSTRILFLDLIKSVDKGHIVHLHVGTRKRSQSFSVASSNPTVSCFVTTEGFGQFKSAKTPIGIVFLPLLTLTLHQIYRRWVGSPLILSLRRFMDFGWVSLVIIYTSVSINTQEYTHTLIHMYHHTHTMTHTICIHWNHTIVLHMCTVVYQFTY